MDSSIFGLHAALEDTHWWFEGRRRIIYPLIDLIMRESDGGTIVDVGCGTGGTIAPLAKRHRTLGVDQAELAIEIARRKYPQGSFRSGCIPEALAGLSDRVAMFLLMDVLEHVSDDHALLHNLVALACPSTHILITVPAGMELWSHHDEIVGHLRRYNRGSLMALWRDLPVTVRLLSYFNARLYTPIRLVRHMSRLFGFSAGCGGTDFSLPPRFINNALTRVFASEASVLEDVFRGRRQAGFSAGVSLIAILRREETRL